MMYRRPLIRGCRSASCSSGRCSRGDWKGDLANGLSRVDGRIKEMYRYQWGVYWVSSNKRHWGMEFYSADIEMLMSGWNTLYKGLFHQKKHCHMGLRKYGSTIDAYKRLHKVVTWHKVVRGKLDIQSRYVTKREFLNYVEANFHASLTYGSIRCFLECQADFVKIIVAPGELPRLQVPPQYPNQCIGLIRNWICLSLPNWYTVLTRLVFPTGRIGNRIHILNLILMIFCCTSQFQWLTRPVPHFASVKQWKYWRKFIEIISKSFLWLDRGSKRRIRHSCRSHKGNSCGWSPRIDSAGRGP
jgi:hypothetical protein